MTSNELRVIRTLIAAGGVLIAVATACGGETDASGGSSETNFQHCKADADCSQGERCVAEVCSATWDSGMTGSNTGGSGTGGSGSGGRLDSGIDSANGGQLDSSTGDSGNDGQVDSGLACTPGTQSDCVNDPTCSWTWDEATTRYPNTCPVFAEPYQAVCGPYNAISEHGVDTSATYYYDPSSGVLLGRSWYSNLGTGCTAFTAGFAAPKSVCTPLAGVDCNTANADGGHDASTDGTHGDGGFGTLCSSDLDCASTLKCCYPCGIPGCQNECIEPLTNGLCPMYP